MIKIFLIVFISIFFSSCSNETKIIPSGKKIHIAILAPLSGENKRYGTQSMLGINAANNMKKYLSNGDEISLHVEDTKADKQTFINAITDVNKSENKIIVSFEGSNSLLKVKEELKSIKTPIIATLATNNDITSLSENMIQICMNNDAQALVAAHFTKDEKFIDNVGIVYDKTNKYSLELAQEFKNIYTKLGGKVEFFNDVSNFIGYSKFKNIDKSKIKLLYSVVGAKKDVKIIRLLKKQNINVDILSTDGLLNNALESQRDNLKLFNGMYVVEHYAHKKYKSKKHKKLKKYLKKYNLQESSYAYLAYDAYQLLYYALDNCVEYDKECISAIMKNSDVIKGISGNFSIIDSKAQREIYVDKIVDAKLIKEIVIY